MTDSHLTRILSELSGNKHTRTGNSFRIQWKQTHAHTHTCFFAMQCHTLSCPITHLVLNNFELGFDPDIGYFALHALPPAAAPNTQRHSKTKIRYPMHSRERAQTWAGHNRTQEFKMHVIRGRQAHHRRYIRTHLQDVSLPEVAKEVAARFLAICTCSRMHLDDLLVPVGVTALVGPIQLVLREQDLRRLWRPTERGEPRERAYMVEIG